MGDKKEMKKSFVKKTVTYVQRRDLTRVRVATYVQCKNMLRTYSERIYVLMRTCCHVILRTCSRTCTNI